MLLFLAFCVVLLFGCLYSYMFLWIVQVVTLIISLAFSCTMK